MACDFNVFYSAHQLNSARHIFSMHLLEFRCVIAAHSRREQLTRFDAPNLVCIHHHWRQLEPPTL